MKRRLWLIPALITGLCMVLSFIAGHYMPWTPLGTPPEPAVEILGASGSAVIVHTAGDKAYQCTHWPRFGYPLSGDCEWEEVNPADFEPDDPENDDRCVYLLPPGWVIDRYYVCGFPGWRYVILSTGSVWGYHTETDDLAAYAEHLRLLFCFPVGTISGFLLGIITYGLLRWRRRRTAKSR